MAEPDPIEIAAAALRHRDRSKREIDDRLARAGVEEDRRADALESLERVGYVDDGRFAATRAASLAARGYGDDYIRHDLAGHELDPEQVEEALAGVAPEAERAAELVARHGRTPKTGAQLARKGFSEDALELALGLDVAGPGA